MFFVAQHRDPVHVEVVPATRLPLWLALTAAALLAAVGFLLDLLDLLDRAR
jgi:hypothetical protein